MTGSKCFRTKKNIPPYHPVLIILSYLKKTTKSNKQIGTQGLLDSVWLSSSRRQTFILHYFIAYHHKGPISQGSGHQYANTTKKNRQENTIRGVMEPTVNSFQNFESWLLDCWYFETDHGGSIYTMWTYKHNTLEGIFKERANLSTHHWIQYVDRKTLGITDSARPTESKEKIRSLALILPPIGQEN